MLEVAISNIQSTLYKEFPVCERYDIPNLHIFRIRAVVDLPKFNVKAGDLGGWTTNRAPIQESWIEPGNVVANCTMKKSYVYGHGTVIYNSDLGSSSITTHHGLILKDMECFHSDINHNGRLESSKLRYSKLLALDTESKVQLYHMEIKESLLIDKISLITNANYGDGYCKNCFLFGSIYYEAELLTLKNACISTFATEGLTQVSPHVISIASDSHMTMRLTPMNIYLDGMGTGTLFKILALQHWIHRPIDYMPCLYHEQRMNSDYVFYSSIQQYAYSLIFGAKPLTYPLIAQGVNTSCLKTC